VGIDAAELVGSPPGEGVVHGRIHSHQHLLAVTHDSQGWLMTPPGDDHYKTDINRYHIFLSLARAFTWPVVSKLLD
jgi:hypothetical protein